MLDADAKQHTTDLVGAARDQDVAQKFFAIEVRMLSILRFKDFFNELPAVIQEQFGVPYVWMNGAVRTASPVGPNAHLRGRGCLTIPPRPGKPTTDRARDLSTWRCESRG